MVKTQITSQAFIIIINNNHTKRVSSGRKISSALPANKTQSFSPALPCCASLPHPYPRITQPWSNDPFCTTHYHRVGRCCSKAVLCNPIIVACTRPNLCSALHTSVLLSRSVKSPQNQPFRVGVFGIILPYPRTLSFFTPPKLQVIVPLLFSSRGVGSSGPRRPTHHQPCGPCPSLSASQP